MRIKQSIEKGQCLILELAEDAGRKKLLDRQVKDLIVQGRRYFVVDLKNIDRMDAAGLGALAATWKTIHAAGGDMKLACVSRRALRLLQVTGLDTVFEIYETPDQALLRFNKTHRLRETASLVRETRERACA